MIRVAQTVLICCLGLLGLYVAFGVAPWWVGIPSVAISAFASWFVVRDLRRRGLVETAGAAVLMLWCSLAFVGMMTGYLSDPF